MKILTRKKSFLRFVALVLAVFITIQDIGQAAGGLISSEGISPSASLAESLQPENRVLEGLFARLDLPSEYGKVDTSHWGGSKQTVIHIRDLHMNEDAQRNIARIIDILNARTGARLVQMEGASGELSHGLLSRYPDRKARVLTGRSLLSEGKLSGPEYLAVTRNPELILVGVEDTVLYEQNRAALLRATELGRGLDTHLEELQKTLRALGVRVFPENVRQWIEKRRQFESNELSIAHYARFLKNLCGREKLSCDAPQIQRLIRLEKIENRVRREERFKTEEELAVYLEDVLKQEGGLDVGIFDEIRQIEKNLEAHWINPPSGLSWDLISPASQAVSQLYKIFRIIEIYQKMFALSLTRDDVVFLYQNRSDFDPYFLSDGLHTLGLRYAMDIRMRGFPFEEMDEALRAFERFYELALARDDTLIQGAFQSMKHYGQNIAVLVTGGFHTPGIEEALRKKGYNFCTITPAVHKKIDFAHDKRLYYRAMQMPQSPVSRFLGDEDSFLQDAAMQLQVPSLFPTSDDLKPLRTPQDLPGWMTGRGRAGDLVTMMISLAATSIRRQSALGAEEMDQAFVSLSPEERFAAGIYKSMHGARTLARSIDQKTGVAVVAFEESLGFGLDIQWKEAPFGSEASENPLRSSFSMVTPDGVRSEIRILTDPLLVRLAAKNFARTAPSRFKSPRLAEPRPVPEKSLPGFDSAPVQERPSPRERPRIEIIDQRPAVTQTEVVPAVPVQVEAETPQAALPEPKKTAFNPIPEISALLLLAASGGSLAALPLAAVVLRLFWFGAIFLHGLGHVTVKWAVDQNRPFDLSEAAEGISVSEFWKGLVPFLSIFTPGLSGQIAKPVATGETAPWKVSLKALGGPLFNLFGAGAAGYILTTAVLSGPAAFALGAVLFLNAVFAALSWSDYASAFSGSAALGLSCGYLDYVGPRLGGEDGSLIPENYIRDITNSTRILSGRGTQAYGFQTLAYDSKGHVVMLGLKDVNPKRAVLHTRLRGDLQREVLRARQDGFRPLPDYIEYSSHLRFGTSTPPSQKETHPHPSPEVLTTYYDWSDASKPVKSRITNFQVSVRHNGDNDGLKEEKDILNDHPLYAFGHYLDYNDVRNELSRILYDDTTKGDSPVIASMLALYSTQGRWDASARLAYLMTAGPLKDSFAGLNSPESIDRVTKRWGSVLEAAFLKHKDAVFVQSGGKWLPNRRAIESQLIPEVRQAVVSQLGSDRYLSGLSGETLDAFVESAVFAFLHQDTYRAIQKLMATALDSSTFGLSVSSTLEPRMKYWVAKGQPGALGHNPDTGAFIAASDPGAVFGGLNERSHFITFNDDHGEIIRLNMADSRRPALNIFSMKEHRELTASEIKGRMVPVGNNPKIKLPPYHDENDSHLKRDLAELSKTLVDIHDSFDPRYRSMTKTPSNRLTADRFNTVIAEVARDRKLRGENSHDTDILFIAEGPSFDLLQRKIEDLKALAPGIHAHVVTGNDYMEKKDAFYSGVGSTFRIGKNTIVFSVSQSGMTFSNVEALRDAEYMRKKGMLKDVFAMTGEWFSILGRSLGQEYFPESDFEGRIFSNMSGRRYSEAATMAAATDFFLTELLIDTFKSMSSNRSDTAPFGMTLSVNDLNRLESNLKPLLNGAVANITGTDSAMRPVESEIHTALLKQGQGLANRISENFWSKSMVRFYTFVSTQLHLPIFRVFALLITGAILLATGVDSFAAIVEALPTLEAAMFFGLFVLAHIFDSFFYTWQDKFFIYALRYMQGRPVYERIGGRFLAIGSPHWSLLRDYFRAALLEAPADLQLVGIDGREAPGDFTHRFKDAGRGADVLIQFADPDQNATPAQASQSGAWRMAISQIDGVRNFDVGPYIMANTTNPNYIKSKRYKAHAVAVSEAETQAAQPSMSDEIYRTLRVRWFEEFKLLVSGQVIAAEMAEKLSRAEIPLYVNRSQSLWGAGFEAFLAVFSRMYSATVLRTHDLMMQKVFRAAPYSRMFTPGKGQSGLTVFTTQINAPRPNAVDAADRLSNKEIAGRLIQEGLDTTMPWVPKAGVFSRILAKLYDAPSMQQAGFEQPVRSSQPVTPAAPVVETVSAPVTPEPKKPAPRPAPLVKPPAPEPVREFAWGKLGGAVELPVTETATRPASRLPVETSAPEEELPAETGKRRIFPFGVFDEPTKRSEVRSAPRLDVANEGRVLTLTVPASTGVQIQDTAGRPHDSLTFYLTGTVYQTADGGMKVTIDLASGALVFSGTDYGFAIVEQGKTVLYKKFDHPVDPASLRHLHSLVQSHSRRQQESSASVTQQLSEPYVPPAAPVQPERISTPRPAFQWPAGLGKFAAGILAVLAGWLAFSQGWITPEAMQTAVQDAAQKTSQDGLRNLAYYGGLTAAGFFIAWQTRDRSTRSSHMPLGSRSKRWLSKAIFIAFFPAFGYAMVALQIAPLSVLNSGLWFFYAAILAGGVFSWFVFGGKVRAVIGVGLLVSLGYMLQNNLGPAVLNQLNVMPGHRMLPDSPDDRSMTEPFSPVSWPQTSPSPLQEEPEPVVTPEPAVSQPLQAPVQPVTFEFQNMTPLLYEASADNTSVQLLAQKEGYLEIDPRSGISVEAWQDQGMAFRVEGGRPLLRYRRPVTETQVSAMRELIERLREIEAQYERAGTRFVPLKTRLANKEAVVTEIIDLFDAEQQAAVFGTLEAPFEEKEQGWILPGKRALGTASSGTEVARFHSQNRLSVRVAVPLSAWKQYDFSALGVHVTLQGKRVESRVLRMTAEPRLNGQMLLTLELYSPEKIFSWNTVESAPEPVSLELALAPRGPAQAYSTAFPPAVFARSYAEMQERIHLPVNPTGAFGRIDFRKSELDWVSAQEKIAGVREGDRRLLADILELGGLFETEAVQYLQQLKDIQSPLAPTEFTRFERVLAKIRALRGQTAFWDYEAPQTGILTGAYESEGQAFHDRPVAEIVTPQIFIRQRIEKRIDVQAGHIVIVRRTATGEETLGIVRQIKRELADESRGEDQSRFQEIVIEVNNLPSFWLGDHEYDIEVLYTLDAPAQTQLQKAYQDHEDALRLRYQPSQLDNLKVIPFAFVLPGSEEDRQLLINFMENPQSLSAPVNKTPEVQTPALTPELEREQRGEVLEGAQTSANEEINRILREFNGDKRRQFMALFLQSPAIPLADIQHIVLYGSSDVSQMSLDYLLRQRRVLDLIAVHQELYRKSAELDMTKLARAHIVELLEHEPEALHRLIQLGMDDPKRALAQDFLVSLLTADHAAYDADYGIVVRKIIESPFWRTYTDKLAFAASLETQDGPFQERRVEAARLIRTVVFADIAYNVRWQEGGPQEHAKERGEILRYDPEAWDRLEAEERVDELEREHLRLPWILQSAVEPETYFQGRIHEERYQKALRQYNGFLDDARKQKGPDFSLMDFQPGTRALRSDHVFNRLDVLTQRSGYIQDLSLHALERFLEMAERPENEAYRARREQVIDRLIKENSHEARRILARSFLKTHTPEVLRLFTEKDAPRILVDELEKIGKSEEAGAGDLLLLQQAVLKITGLQSEPLSMRQLALRTVLDTLSDFDLRDLAGGRHPLEALLEKEGVAQDVVRASAAEQLRRHELLWAQEKAAEWQSARTIRSYTYVEGEPALNNLEQALGNENLTQERVELAIEAGRREHSQLFHRLESLTLELDAQIKSGSEREVSGHFQTWRFSLGAFLKVFGFVFGLIWVGFHLRSAKPFWPGKSKARSELRTVPEAMIQAAQSRDVFVRQVRLDQEFSFETYEQRARTEKNTNLERILDGMDEALRTALPPSVPTLEHGEIILTYKAESHSDAFSGELASLLESKKGIRRLTVLKSAETTEAQWRTFKNSLKVHPVFSPQRIVFADEMGAASLEALAEDRLKALGGLPREALVQVLSPSSIRRSDLLTYEKFLLKAAPLGRETLLVLGSDEPLPGAGHTWTVGEALEMAFQAYSSVAASA